jgi:hypothetical protein
MGAKAQSLPQSYTIITLGEGALLYVVEPLGSGLEARWDRSG